MLEGIINAAIASAPPELISTLKKLDEFNPIIDAYHKGMPINEDDGELEVAYMLRFEPTGIILYQVALASKKEVGNGKPYVSRQLNKWDVSQKIRDLTAKAGDDTEGGEVKQLNAKK